MSLIEKIDAERTTQKILVTNSDTATNSMFHFGVGEGLIKAKNYPI